MAYYPPPNYQQPDLYYGWQQQAYYQHQPPQPPLPAPEALPPPPARHSGNTEAAPVAFTRVKATSVPAAKTEEKSSAWPESLRQYTQRAFMTAKSPEDKAQLQVHLKNLINTAQSRGELWTKNWAALALPEYGSKSSGILSGPSAQTHETSMSVVRPSSPFKMTFRKGNVLSNKRGRSLSPPPEPLHVSPALTKKQTKAARRSQRRKDYILEDTTLQDQQRELARARRFGNGTAVGIGNHRAEKNFMTHSSDGWDDYDTMGYDASQDNQAVRGTCQEIEKSYFRLTSKPEPSAVRPEAVLERALHRLVELLRTGQVTYFYASDQFKGMRQDCTVQHLQNSVSASIYEAHARCALEHGDTAEYNQCQAQLMQHYQAGIVGAREEFTAYRILHQSIHVGRGNHAALLSCLQSITPEVCLLYESAPNMGRALLDMVLPRVRLTGLKILAKSFLPTLPISTIALRLGFAPAKSLRCVTVPTKPGISALPGSTKASYTGRHNAGADNAEAENRCGLWLKEHGAVLVSVPGVESKLAMDCKASVGQLRAPDKAPEPQGPDLAIDDFLARAVS